VTLEVSLLGEEKKVKKIKCWLHYLLASSISGACFGFLFTIVLYLMFAFIPHVVKIILLGIIVGLYILSELKILKLSVPQRKWQIPSTWLQESHELNMWIWGTILGAGIFTFIPYITFYIIYLVSAMFFEPYMGSFIGAIYGFARAFASILISLPKLSCDINITALYRKKHRLYKGLNIASLILVLACLIYMLLIETSVQL
jgi:hypothetical protein